MSSLIINRVLLEIGDTNNLSLFVSNQNNNGFHKKFQYLKSDIYEDKLSAENTEKLKHLKDEDDCYYTFFTINDSNAIELSPNEYKIDNLKIKYIRELLCNIFKSKGFIVNKNPGYGTDLSIYERIDSYNSNWDRYRRYDFKLFNQGNIMSFVIGSESTLISKAKQQVNERKIIVNNIVTKFDSGNKEHIVIADNRTKSEIGYDFSAERRKKFSYKESYQSLISFYNNVLQKIEDERVKVQAGGLKTVENIKVKQVSFKDNLMLFGSNKTDINPVSGLRNYGIYSKSPLADKINFIFIYKESSDANTLFAYLKSGLKHFPGLLSYVGIPITRLDKDKSLKYDNENDLRNKIKEHILNHFPETQYQNYFAIVIQPFSKSEPEIMEEDEQDELYYLIKGLLLNKGISSQFIKNENIHKADFHYHLPNIAIAILAKLRGIPWKLKSHQKNELIVGFNCKKVDDTRFIGSAVYFSNDGLIGKTAFFSETNNNNEIVKHLRQSIQNYITEKSEKPERLIIHYYKSFSLSEKQKIENLIKKEFHLELPFALVEINDTKSSQDICFDVNNNYGMPLSGTYTQLSKNEYLLFNNNRYEAQPARTIIDELPIKIKIHFADTGGFSHYDLINQIYEFSRLYWRSLKQKSQPVTTVYSKYIADFRSKYSDEIIDNDTVNNSPWFL